MSYINKLRTINALLACAMCLLSCQPSGLIETDLTNLKSNEQRLNADDLYAAIQTTALETSEKCLLSFPTLVTINDSDLIIVDRNELLRFGCDGKYKNNIGVYGHGEGEHGALYSVSYDSNTRVVYAFSPPDEVIKYDIGGRYLGRFAMDLGGDDMFLSGCWSQKLGVYVAETRLYKEKGVEINIRTYSSDGRKCETYQLYRDDCSVTTNFIRGSKIRPTNDGVFVMAPYDNTIYLLGHNGLTPQYVIDRGKHTPTRELVENADNASKLDNMCYYIDNMVVTPKYFYLYVSADNGYNDVLINRDDGEIVHNCHYKNNDEANHIKTNDLRYSFWPWCCHGQTVGALIENTDDVESNPIVVTAVEK